MTVKEYTDLAESTLQKERSVNSMFRMANTARRMGNEPEASRLWDKASVMERDLMEAIGTLNDWEKENRVSVGNWHRMQEAG